MITTTKNNSSNAEYKAIPITIFGIKYFDKILYGKMFMIDLHFHNIYRNYQKYLDIRSKEILVKINSKDSLKVDKILNFFLNSKNNKNKLKNRYLKRIIREIEYMNKYLMRIYKEYI